MEKLRVEPLPLGLYDEAGYLAYLEGRDDALVVDPGAPAEQIREAVGRAGRRLTAILITHGHFDHTLGAAGLRELTGARIYIHPLDAPMLKSPEPLKMAPEIGARFHPCEPDALIEPGPLELCGMGIEALHTPGHSPGGVCYYLPDERALFTGDTLFRYGFGRTDFAGGSSRALRASLLRLLALPGETAIFPGHGESARLSAVKEYFS